MSYSKENYRDYRHPESLTLFLLKDKASHTQTRTNKNPEKRNKGKNLPSVPSRQACSFGPNRGKMVHAAPRSTSSVRSPSAQLDVPLRLFPSTRRSTTLPTLVASSTTLSALVTAAAGCLSPHDDHSRRRTNSLSPPGCLSPHDHTTNHRTTEQPSSSSSRPHTVHRPSPSSHRHRLRSLSCALFLSAETPPPFSAPFLAPPPFELHPEPARRGRVLWFWHGARRNIPRFHAPTLDL